jgi:hypothetical protein
MFHSPSIFILPGIFIVPGIFILAGYFYCSEYFHFPATARQCAPTKACIGIVARFA